MKIVGIDFETTGLDPATDQVTEIGAVLFDWEGKIPLQILSCFVLTPKPLPEEIIRLTGITDEMLADFGRTEADAFSDLDWLIDRSDYAMAHNGAEFDLKFYKQTCARLGRSPQDKLWLDSKTDIRYPESIITRSLGYLAAEHNFLNPFRHRAVFDVLTMLNVASNYDLQSIVARAMEPTVYARAIVTFDQKDKAKDRGYYWYPKGKIWWRSFKQSDYLAEKDTCGFVTMLLEKPPEEPQ